MGLLCGIFRRRGPDQSERKPKRARTMSIFGNSNPNALETIKHLIELTTVFTSPALKPWKKPPAKVPTESTSDTSTEPSQHSVHDLHDIHMTLGVRAKLEALYDELRGGDHTLSKDRLVPWLRDHQGESSIELKQDLFDMGGFLYVLTHIHPLNAVKPLPAKDLSKPLSNYFISSSHNTYLEGNQISSRSSPEAYKTALSRGCRCIEIDVWNGDAVVTTTANGAKSPKIDHSRGFSASSVSNFATTVHDTVEDARFYLGEKTASTHSRSPSTHSRAVFEDISPRTSVVVDPKDSKPKIELNPPSRGRSHSRSMPRGEPIVTHGWTLTAPCGFREVCQAIKESAFVDNDLPIIISLEVHADVEQQKVMVAIMKEVWGDLLLQEAFQGCDPRFHLPTLDELRNKILIKVKRAPAKIMAPQNPRDLPAACADDEDASCSEDERPAPISTGQSLAKLSSNLESGPPQQNVPKVHITPSLGALAIYTRSEPFRGTVSAPWLGFDTPRAKDPPHIFSIGENKILEMYEKHHRAIFTHNKNYFMRAFPAGRRVDSSNPDPSLFWRKGVQMVAMNWQNMDEGMMLNEGMFADEQGWVLKPQGYRSTDKHASTQDEADGYRTLDLVITVLAAQHVQVPNDNASGAIHPVVKAELHVERATEDPDTYKQKTESKKSDHFSFAPHGAALKFLNTPKVVEELSFIRFKIEDTGYVTDELLSWACIRLDRLGTGYRFVRLMDNKCHPIPGGKLLVNIEKTLR